MRTNLIKLDRLICTLIGIAVTYYMSSVLLGLLAMILCLVLPEWIVMGRGD